MRNFFKCNQMKIQDFAINHNIKILLGRYIFCKYLITCIKLNGEEFKICFTPKKKAM